MRLTRLTIQNFRNPDGVDIPLAGSPVIVGENRVGKSNLVHAIRLVLDSSLGNAARRLRTEDFSDHLGPDPIADGAEIRISIEIEDFGEDAGLMAALRHAIVSGDPMRARITYRFGPGELEQSGEGVVVRVIEDPRPDLDLHGSHRRAPPSPSFRVFALSG